MFGLRIYSSVSVLSIVYLMMIHSEALPVDNDETSEEVVSGSTQWNLKDQMTNTIIFENWLLGQSNESIDESESNDKHHLSKRFIDPFALIFLLISFSWRLFSLLTLIPRILLIFL